MDKLYRLFKIDISNNRIIGLDLLRMIAISLVMILHGHSLLPDSFKYISQLFSIDGVSLFFVLSGFLIGGILIKDIENLKQNNIKINYSHLLNFLKKRWFRTLPNYYFILTILVIYFVVFQYNYSFDIYAKYYLFLQNFAWESPSFFPEAWSLSVEEWFYLVVPTFLFTSLIFFQDFSLKKVLFFISIIIIISSIILRFIKYSQIGIITDFDIEYRKQVVYRLDSIMFGVLSAMYFFYCKKSFMKFRYLLFSIGIILFISQHVYMLKFNPNDFYLINVCFIIESISIFLMIPFLYYLNINNFYLKYLISYISVISFSMYLLNYSIVKYGFLLIIDWEYIYFVLNKYDIPYLHTIIRLFEYLVFWLLTILLSALNYKYFELYFLKLRNRYTTNDIINKSI